ncbi:MAG: hypothetical protein PHH77_09980 [Victivallaceae bacterium]|nr:hypothetical protein [Victivallaceae bacterium]
MLKNKKKKIKTEAQKKTECGRNIVEPFGNFSKKKMMDVDKLIEKFLDLDSEDSNFGDEDESKIFELVGKSFNICSLAWDISQAGGTYEKSIIEIDSLPLDEMNLTERMGTKFLLTKALRIKFSLPSDEESVIRAAKDIFTPEELKCFYEKIDLSGLKA